MHTFTELLNDNQIEPISLELTIPGESDAVSIIGLFAGVRTEKDTLSDSCNLEFFDLRDSDEDWAEPVTMERHNSVRVNFGGTFMYNTENTPAIKKVLEEHENAYIVIKNYGYEGGAISEDKLKDFI